MRPLAVFLLCAAAAAAQPVPSLALGEPFFDGAAERALPPLGTPPVEGPGLARERIDGVSLRGLDLLETFALDGRRADPAGEGRVEIQGDGVGHFIVRYAAEVGSEANGVSYLFDSHRRALMVRRESVRELPPDCDVSRITARQVLVFDALGAVLQYVDREEQERRRPSPQRRAPLVTCDLPSFEATPPAFATFDALLAGFDLPFDLSPWQARDWREVEVPDVTGGASALADLVEREIAPGDSARLEAGRGVRPTRRLTTSSWVPSPRAGAEVMLRRDDGVVRRATVRSERSGQLMWEARYAFDPSGRTATVDFDVFHRVPVSCMSPSNGAGVSGRAVLDERGEVVAFERSPPPEPGADPACHPALRLIPVGAYPDVPSLLRALEVPPLAELDWRAPAVVAPPPPSPPPGVPRTPPAGPPPGRDG